MIDVLIVGAGPAGLTAAIYARRSGLSTIVTEALTYGGQMTDTPEVENYPAVKNISGAELAENMYEQATSLGADIRFETVNKISDLGEYISVTTDAETYEASALIMANGVKRRKLDCEGEEKFSGRGVSYCATCDGAFFSGKTVTVIGGGNTALEDALYLSNICEKVYLVHRRDSFRGERYLIDSVSNKSNISILYSYVPVEIKGDNSVSSVVLRNVCDNTLTDINTAAVFVAVGMIPDNSIVKDIVQLDKDGYIIADENTLTNNPRIFAAGDTRTKKLRQIITAASDGAVAASHAASILR